MCVAEIVPDAELGLTAEIFRYSFFELIRVSQERSGRHGLGKRTDRLLTTMQRRDRLRLKVNRPSETPQGPRARADDAYP